MSTDEFLESFIANECIWNTHKEDPKEKVAAWRYQMLIVHYLSKDLPSSYQLQLLDHHNDRTSTTVFDEFISDCVNSMERLLRDNSEPIGKMPISLDKFPELTDDIFEKPCHGEYESCKEVEVTAEQLSAITEDLAEQKSESIRNDGNFSATGKRKLDCSSGPLMRPSFVHFLKPPRVAGKIIDNKKEDVIIIDSDNEKKPQFSGFRTAREELVIQNQKKKGAGYSNGNGSSVSLSSYGGVKKSLGARRTVTSGFVPPVRMENSSNATSNTTQQIARGPTTNGNSSPNNVEDERLLNIDPKMIEMITNEIMHNDKPFEWNDIAGLDNVKAIIKESVVYPLLRPDLFQGPLGTPRGILLFGPPGTGKTMFGKCIASQSKSTFFNISASTLTSKWVGEGEKMVRALFAVAAVHQPSVIFIDEIDSLLCHRSDTEHEGTRRMKTEFMIQFDGVGTRSEDQILLVGATNRPQELDEAVRRRFTRRLYIPLPELEARVMIVSYLLKKINNNLNEEEIQTIGQMTDGYSAADVKTLCSEAFMGPLRSIPYEQIPYIRKEDMRPVNAADFTAALTIVPPSVAQKDLTQYTEWNSIYGSLK